jgi:hypothetical protein
MKRFLVILFAFLLVYACKKDEKPNVMYVKGSVSGLKKGTLYLQKQIDSLVVTVDSVEVNDSDEFLLTDVVTSPEMYYVALANTDKKIPFFGEKDTVYISTTLQKFSYKHTITGSDNQKLLDDYYEIIRKFNNQNLDLQKAGLEARIAGIADSIAGVENKKNNLLKKRYLYSINYAINHADHEVSPYIALTDLVDANPKWLDSIYNSLTPEVKKSKYGEELKTYIVSIKALED